MAKRKRTARILIVEDEFIVSKNLESRLISMGFDVVGVSTKGEDAIAVIPTLKPDLILMDIMLAGDLNGIETARKIENKHGLPVIFLTAYSSHEMLEKAKLAHPFGYILKPYEERELEVNISIALYRNEVEKNLVHKEHELVKLNNSLEDEVEKRTKELRNTNTKLTIEIEERKRAEEQLVKFYELFHVSPNLVGITSNGSTELYLNQAARSLFSIGKRNRMDSGAISKLVRDIGIAAQITDIRKDLLANGIWVGELNLKVKGRNLVVLATIVLHRSDDGKISNISIIGHDITDQKLAQRRIAKAQKLEVSIEKRKQKIRAAALFQGQEKERKRVSKELHDGIGQILAASKRKILNSYNSNIKLQKDLVVDIDLAIDELRRISANLMPSVLEHFGLIPSLQYLIRQFTEKEDIDIQFKSNVTEIKVTDELKITLYRIVQEALNNTMEHAKASEVKVLLNCSGGLCRLEISDNGKGFEVKKFSRGNLHQVGKGLSNMKERIELLGGNFKIESQVGKGTRLTIKNKLNSKKDVKFSRKASTLS